MGDKQTAIKVLQALSGRSGPQLWGEIYKKKYTPDGPDGVDCLDALALAEYAASCSIGTSENEKRTGYATQAVSYALLAIAKHLIEGDGNGNSSTGSGTDGEHPPTGEGLDAGGGATVD